MTDRRNPEPSSKETSRVMKANKAKGTGPEVALRKGLRIAGFPGYRTNYGKISGHPDIVYVSHKVAIFVNGCFWHRCPKCNLPLPKSHTDFWAAKFQRNVERDARKTAALEAEGWIVITVWECEIDADLPAVVERVGKVLRNRSAHFYKNDNDHLDDGREHAGRRAFRRGRRLSCRAGTGF